MKRKQYNTRASKQSGMSAILFASVFLIILSLLSVGFASLVRRDQQEVVDKSLSSQAQYAAETAINRTAIKLRANPDVPAPSTCTESLDLGSVSPTTPGAQVTCITWSTVPDIRRDSLSQRPYVVPLKSASGSIFQFTVTWGWEGSANNYTPVPTLPQINQNNRPILRMTIVDITSGTPKTFFIIPRQTGSALSYGSTSGALGVATCGGAGSTSCSITINNISIPDSDRYRLVLQAYGREARDIVIAPPAGSSFAGAQVEIDANAIALDVSKRVIARVSLEESTWRPGFGLASENICKDFIADGDQDRAKIGTVVCPQINP